MNINDEYEINPNDGKEFLKNLLTIFIIVILIIGLLMFLQAQVGLEFVTNILEAFNIQMSTGTITLILSLIFVGGAIILLLFNYINIRNQKYILHNDRIEYVGTQAFLFLQKETIPFQNITRITFSNDDLLDKLMNCGKINIELSGLKIPEITLESIDKPDVLTNLIQQKVNQFNMQKQMQYQEQKRVEGIMDRF